jgi:hypothetical protein
MSILKRLPWLSLFLLILTYGHLGWIISTIKAPWFVWLVIAIANFFLMTGLTASWVRIASSFGFIFKSDSKTFIFAVLAALLFFVMIAKFRLFLDTLVIVAAIILAKLDFQTARFKESQAFWISFCFSLASLAVGALIEKLIEQ